MANCKGCGAEVKWITMPTGKNMICDAKLTQGAGEWKGVLVLDNGVIIQRPTSEIRGHVPHWATCPKAKDFKTKKK